MQATLSGALAGPSEAFVGPAGVTGLLYDSAASSHPSPAVLIVHDTLGIDRRSQGYIAQLGAAGVLVLEVELHASSADGLVTPFPSDEEAGHLVSLAAAALARDPRVSATHIGALGFGVGARAVALAQAGNGRPMFAARVLLYPGCATLAPMLSASPRDRWAAASPVLILHGEDDPANTPAQCEDLATVLDATSPARRISYRGASYAWDVPQVGDISQSALPWPRLSRSIPVHSWPELAELTAAQAAAFLSQAMREPAARAAAAHVD
ncbi:MAG TPA: dienelactone hydrolase family protein [Acetobacteraceae bacterium]|nr:dienelactone hydrolase family protein [Acetobacteraceae bacterium]